MPLKKNVCHHIADLESLKNPRIDYCEECIKTGDTWLHLRVCQTCGKVHCCDSSPNRHAAKHYESTGHAVVIPAEKNAGAWAYCFVHQAMADVSHLK